MIRAGGGGMNGVAGNSPGVGPVPRPASPPPVAPRGAALLLLWLLLGLPSALLSQDDPLTRDWEEDWTDPATSPALPTLEDRLWDFDLVRGLRFRGPDGVPRLHGGGRLRLSAWERDPRSIQPRSELRLEKGALHLDGEALDRIWLTIEADLDGRDTRDGLRRAIFATRLHAFARLSVGLQDPSIGIEGSLDPDRSIFSGPAFGPWLADRTDLGIRLDGELLRGFLSYDLAYCAGEGFDLDGERIGEPRTSLRISLSPLTESVLIPALTGPAAHLEGLFLTAGLALEEGFHRPLIVETPSRDRLFETVRIDADDARWWSYGWGVDGGDWRLTHEWMRGTLEGVRTGGTRTDLRNQLRSMTAILSWRLGGPSYDSHPFRQRPARPFPAIDAPPTPPDTELPFALPGPIELAIRYANGDLDRRLFELGLADDAVSSQEFRTITAALGIEPAPFLRLSIEATRVIADQSPAAFDGHGRGTTIGFHAELRF